MINIFHKQSILFLSLFGGVIAFLISDFIQFKINTTNFNYLVMLVTLIPVILYLIVSAKKKTIIITHPMFIYPLCYFFVFGYGSTLNDINPEIAYIGGVSTLIGCAGYITAFIIFSFVDKTSSYRKSKVLDSELTLKDYISYSIFFERVLFIIGFGAFLLFIMRIGSIPLFMPNLEQSRVDANISGGSSLRILTYLLIVSSVIAFFNFYYSKKNKLTKNNISLLVSIIGVLSLLALGNRSPAFTIIYSCAIIFFLLKYEGKLKIKTFLVTSIIVSIGILIFVGGIGSYRVINTSEFHNYPEYEVFLEESDYIGLSLFVFEHYLGISFFNFSRVIELFPNVLDFKYGLSYIEPILTILPGTQYTLDMQIKHALGQTYLGGGTIPSVLGEAYANFGYFGCFIIPFLTTLLLSFLYKKYLEQKNNPARILIYVFFLCYFSWYLIAGYAATSIFPFISVCVYFLYRIFLYSLGKTNFDVLVKKKIDREG